MNRLTAIDWWLWCWLETGSRSPSPKGRSPFTRKPHYHQSGGFVGTLTPGSPKTTVITKFPTIASDDGRFYIGSSTGGGRYFGIAINRAGCHHLVISGKAPKPVYLRILDEEIEIVEANDLWGKGIVEVSNALVHRKDENLVLWSSAKLGRILSAVH